MQKANVSHGKAKMDKMVRKESYPVFVVLGHFIEGESLVMRCHVHGKKKVMKKQRRSKEKGLREKLFFVARIGVCKSVGPHFVFRPAPRIPLKTKLR
jgi:hypothetical protein